VITTRLTGLIALLMKIIRNLSYKIDSMMTARPQYRYECYTDLRVRILDSAYSGRFAERKYRYKKKRVLGQGKFMEVARSRIVNGT
jgi:hypothetical protein